MHQKLSNNAVSLSLSPSFPPSLPLSLSLPSSCLKGMISAVVCSEPLSAHQDSAVAAAGGGGGGGGGGGHTVQWGKEREKSDESEADPVWARRQGAGW